MMLQNGVWYRSFGEVEMKGHGTNCMERHFEDSESKTELDSFEIFH